MHFTFILRRFALGLLLAASLGAAELPAPLTSALDRLRSADGYGWTLDTQMPGSPFSFAPIKGWARGNDEGMMTAALDGKVVEAVVLRNRRVVKQDAGWVTSSEAAPKKGAEAGELYRLFNLPLPGETLDTLLGKASGVRANPDGSFTADFGAEVATEIVRYPTQYLPKRRLNPTMKDGVASLQIWIKDGAIARYEISGNARVSLPIGSKEIKQRTVVEFHPPTVEVVLPPDALTKLRAMTSP